MNGEIGRRLFLSGTAMASGLSLSTTSGWANLASRDRQDAALALRFAVASDGHFGQQDTDFRRFHRELAGWLKREASGRGLDFVVFNGDLIHDDPGLLPQVKQEYDLLEIPYYTVRGNHDAVPPGAWQDTWGYPENHAFIKGECAFILVNTSNQKGEYLCGDVVWLKQQLESAVSRKWTFVFLHICQHAITRHGIDCPEVTALLEGTPNVAAVFHGHDHDQDNVVFVNKRAYFFDGHFGGSWGTAYRGYRIVEVDISGAVVTYQCNPQAFYVNSNSLP